METTLERLGDLATTGTLDIGGGFTLRFRQEPDEFTTMNDFDCYGRTEWSPNNRYTGNTHRPDGFDGMAEKLVTDRGNTLWWQPPAGCKDDRRQWHTDKTYQRAMRQTVRDIVEYGFVSYVVELVNGTDAYGRPIVVDFACVGGVEPFAEIDLGCLDDVVAQLKVPQNV